MRIGTFRCWLFGHCFVGTSTTIWPKDDPRGTGYSNTDYLYNHCVRCGIEKSELKSQYQKQP